MKKLLSIGYADDTPKQGDAASGNKSRFGLWQSQITGNAVEKILWIFLWPTCVSTLAFCKGKVMLATRPSPRTQIRIWYKCPAGQFRQIWLIAAIPCIR
jgi:hypothetical protein